MKHLFFGGVHPADRKELSANCLPTLAPVPSQVIIPMSQHIGAPCTPLVKVGDTVKLPKAPTKKGYAFKCWKGSEYEAGAEYKVEGDHAFTAEWEKDAEPDKPAIPKTGDALAGAAATALAAAAIALLTLAVCVVRRRRA